MNGLVCDNCEKVLPLNMNGKEDDEGYFLEWLQIDNQPGRSRPLDACSKTCAVNLILDGEAGKYVDRQRKIRENFAAEVEEMASGD